VELLRDNAPDLGVELNAGGGSYKSQFKRADKSGAAIALILGEAELESRTLGIKALRSDTEQATVSWDDIVAAVRAHLT
jgi:histidyl-tRNA synthetase